MATIHINVTTTSTPEQFVAGLTDFGPGRQELFGNSAVGIVLGIFGKRVLGKELVRPSRRSKPGTTGRDHHPRRASRRHRRPD